MNPCNCTSPKPGNCATASTVNSRCAEGIRRTDDCWTWKELGWPPFRASQTPTCKVFKTQLGARVFGPGQFQLLPVPSSSSIADEPHVGVENAERPHINRLVFREFLAIDRDDDFNTPRHGFVEALRGKPHVIKVNSVAPIEPSTADRDHRGGNPLQEGLLGVCAEPFVRLRVEPIRVAAPAGATQGQDRCNPLQRLADHHGSLMSTVGVRPIRRFQRS